MTPADLQAWIDARNISKTEAARQLGCSRNQLAKWLAGKLPVPHTIALACSALAFNLPPWGGHTKENEGE